MMLGDLTLPIDVDTARSYALVFGVPLAARLAELHAIHGSQKLVPWPVQLMDGRLMLSADLLTEVLPGGMLAPMWAAADQSVLLQAVEVIPWEDAVAMIDQGEPEPMPEE